MTLTAKQYEYIAREKVRFETSRGKIPLEDLYGLPLTGNGGYNLDAIAVGINEELNKKNTSVVSFVSSTSKNSKDITLLQLKLEVLLDIIKTKKDEQYQIANENAKAAELRTYKELLKQKEFENMQNLTEDEIKAKIAELSK